jgi:hypothetical protein
MTLNGHNLESIGVFHFLVREKKIVKLHEEEVPQYCLYLSTETGEYGSTVTVSRKKYIQARVGKLYGLCSVIRNIKHDYDIVVTDETDPEHAIKKTVHSSRLKMTFLMVVLGLCSGTVMIFLYALLEWIRIST